MKRLLVPLLFFLSTPLVAQNFPDGFSFYMPPDDSTAQKYLPEFPAEEITDFISIDENGHFTSEGTPIRFWGFNLSAAANFPVRDKAHWIASRMRKLGINLLRFHHMDNPWTNNDGTIFLRGTGNTRDINPITQDRLHYFLSRMKANGIYANMNLHVSRTFLEGDGVAGADSIRDFGKAVTIFDPQLIELQKEYARKLLTTTNPFTGLALVDDPVMAMVEITNENTLYGYWRGDALYPFIQGGGILQRQSDWLDNAWNEFLRDKYTTQETLEAAWSKGQVASGVEEQIRDGDFESGNLNENWQIELHETAAANLVADQQTVYEGSTSARVTVNSVTGTDWHIQFKQNQLTFQQDSTYALTFVARSNRERDLTVAAQRDVNPWTWYGGTRFRLTTEWKEFVFTFTIPEDVLGVGRITFSFDNELGPVWFDNMSLAAPEQKGVEEGESLEEGTVQRILYTRRLSYTPQRVKDMAEFYLNLQTAYFDDMYDFLKNELGVKVPITGSNALIGLPDVLSMKSLDYIDDHAYWDHPRFPNEPWSQTDWLINNTSMLNAENLGTIPGIFGGLAMKGKPYTISEYNHGFPNRFETEMIPILTAYASFHDADGLMFFTYSGGSHLDWENDYIDGFFDTHRNPALMALSPVFAKVYRDGLLSSAQNQVGLNFPAEFVYGTTQGDNLGRWGKFYPYNPEASKTQAVRISGFESGIPPALDQISPDPQSVFATNNEETLTDTDRGIMRTVSEQFVSLSGFLDKASGVEFGPATMRNANDFGVLGWLSLTDSPVELSERSVIVLSSKAQNSGMVWEGNSTVRNRWGQAPTLIAPLVVELELRIPAETLTVFPLDATGEAGTSTTYQPISPGVFQLTFDQKQMQTTWFGIEAKGGAVSVDTELASAWKFEVAPNPADDYLRLTYQLSESRTLNFRLTDIMGRTIKNWPSQQVSPGPNQEILSLQGIAPGIYTLEIHSGERFFSRRIQIVP